MIDRTSNFQGDSPADEGRPRGISRRSAQGPPTPDSSPPQPPVKIASRDEIMQRLESVAGLVAIDVLKPQQANVMKGIYHTLLQEHARGQSSAAQAGGIDDAMLPRLQTQPELLNLLTPLLTDAQVRMVMQAHAPNGDGDEPGHAESDGAAPGGHAHTDAHTDAQTDGDGDDHAKP